MVPDNVLPMFTAANDNALPRARLIPLLGELNVDTGLLTRGAVVTLLDLPPGAILGPIRWPADVVAFPNDHREV